jgi:3-hydroxymyristoyl/3-hydroxydecanoyl-(acyl carrier protein) dehydratase
MNNPTVTFNEADVLEFAEGRVSELFGPRYAQIDSMRRRVRIPGPPMLAISRVAEIEGVFGSLDRARIVTEYDIPDSFWNSINGRASALVMDPQGLQFLIGWLGGDIICGGDCSYRWIAGDLTYLAKLPKVGQRVRTEVRLKRAIRRGRAHFCNAEFDVSGAGVPRLRGRCVVGLFSQGLLPEGSSFRSVSWARDCAASSASPTSSRAERASGTAGLVGPSLRASTEALLQNPLVESSSQARQLAPRMGQFVDRVVRVSPNGGHYGLGFSEGEVRLDPLHWAVRAHFKDDPVYPGPCMLEGATQLLQFHCLAIGLQGAVSDAHFQPIVQRTISARFRSQLVPRNQIVSYRAHVSDLGVRPEPFLVADIEVVCEEVVVGRIDGLGVRLSSEGIA